MVRCLTCGSRRFLVRLHEVICLVCHHSWTPAELGIFLDVEENRETIAAAG
jgi:hypothetical protein